MNTKVRGKINISKEARIRRRCGVNV